MTKCKFKCSLRLKPATSVSLLVNTLSINIFPIFIYESTVLINALEMTIQYFAKQLIIQLTVKQQKIYFETQ